MKKCPICNTNDADKKNVHLIPWFLIKKCITQRGSGERDMEFSFSIDPQSFTRVYTGRSVLPETIKNLGELHDLEKEKENPYSRDNLICTECEKNLSRLEAIFAFQFTEQKLKNVNQSNLDKLNGNAIFINKRYNPSLYELLIQSIFYRCSIGQFNGFRLNVKIENKIKENLRQAFLFEGFKKMKTNANIEIPYKFPLITASFVVEEGEDPTKNFIVVNNSRFPYFIMAGKWMFQLFESEKHIKSTIEWLYGLKDKLKSLKAYNIVKGTSHVILLERGNGKSISKNLIDSFVEKKGNGLKKSIKNLHIRIFSSKPNTDIIQYIYKHYFVHLDEGKTEFDAMIHAFHDLKKLS